MMTLTRGIVLQDCGVQGDDYKYILRIESENTMNRELISRYYNELWNRWRFELISELLKPGIVFRGSLGIEVVGHDGFRNYMETVRIAFPDFCNEIEETISEGERIAVRLTYRGTHDGPLLGVPATGRRVSYCGFGLFHIEAGQIADGWVLGDTMALWRQIGHTPPDRSD